MFQAGKMLVAEFILIAIANNSGQAHVVLNEKKLPYSTTLQVWSTLHTDIQTHMCTYTATHVHIHEHKCTM